MSASDNHTAETTPGQGDPASHTLACFKCRTRKVRCIYGPEGTNGKCRRCARNGEECVFKQRRLPQRSSRLRTVCTRIEQLEQSLESIVSRFANNEHNGSQSEHVDASLHYAASPVSIVAPLAEWATLGNSEYQCDLFERGIVTMAQADWLCGSYPQMSELHFPYVILPEGHRVDRLRIEKPLLLHAILTTATWKTRALQLVLEKELTRNLMESIFTRGEATLDILQALLVYIGWFHFHTKPPLQQAYRLASVAATMVIELGLHREPGDGKYQTSAARHRVASMPRQSPMSSDFWSVEARRAMLGCHFLCSMISMASQKPNPFPYSNYVETCALSLHEERQISSDPNIIHHLRLARLGEEIADTFNYPDRWEGRHLSGPERIKVCVREFDRQVNKIRTDLLPLTIQSRAINVWCLVMSVYAHGRALCGEPDDCQPSISHTALVFDCLTKTKEYFDAVTELPLEDIQTWNLLEWKALHYVVVLISEISPRISSAIQNDETTASLLDFDHYLEALCARLKDLLLLTGPPNGQKICFQQLLFLWEDIRSSNQAVVEDHATNWQHHVQAFEFAPRSATSCSTHAMDFESFDFAGQDMMWFSSTFPI